jgi:2-polyprenyl-6-methoxyphenol hydroxylase-like FAD-dependent oxidoreductase
MMDPLMPAAMPARFDAVVVGAGPAGSTVAIQLARAGWAVALVERQRFPRRKVCGECIAASNLPLLERLGIADAFDALAGTDLRQVTLLRGDDAVTADLPPADHDRYPWGHALGRESLDGLLLEQARAAGAVVFQPCAVQAILGTAGAWHCELRPPESATLLRLRAKVVVDAHGSWEDLPSDRPRRRQGRSAADLFAFKANFSGSKLPRGQISVLALDGGYGGMVVADHGMTTLACCIRRDRLSELRGGAPGLSASGAVEAWLLRECAGVRQALLGATRDGPWLTSGPLDPGVRLNDEDGIFRVGNAAGEAHPILGEGMSMALQSAALLCSHLLGHRTAAAVPGAAAQAELQLAYAASWRRQFGSRLRLAAVFAHLAMRPRSAAALMLLLRLWPRLLTRGARWGGKVRTLEWVDATDLARAWPPGARQSLQRSSLTHPREESR